MRAENRVIQMLWIGPRLSKMEQLSIRSFQAHGHEVHLYVYGLVENIPEGTIVKDGNEVVAESRIKDFRYLAQFSNLFVYKLLLDNGGYFSDCDNVCLRPLDFPEPYVFYRDADQSTVTAALCKCPKDSPLMQRCYDTVNNLSPDQLQRSAYQALGPDLTRKLIMPNAVFAYGFGMRDGTFEHLQQYLRPGITFDPI